jgi:urease accessory protein
MRAISVTSDIKNACDTVTLDENLRHRRRVKLVSDHGLEFLLDLPHARLLRHGQGLVLEDGRVIEVLAMAEPLYRVSGRDRQHLLTLAWQIGNRHLAAQINESSILIREDQVIRAMLEGLGATVTELSAPFDPEGGAYGDRHHSHG